MDHPPQPDLASIAGVIGQPARAAMLNALLGGQWLTATELARHGGVAGPTASEHLAGLVDAGLVVRRRSGRHRYHALGGPDVAAALEALGRISAAPATTSPSAMPAESALRFARICYDHLAGELGVLIADTLVERGLLAPTGADLTPSGDAWLGDLGIDAEALRTARRAHVRFCLDWSEPRDHPAGAVGAAITSSLFERRWIVRLEGSRAVRLTARGRDRLFRALA